MYESIIPIMRTVIEHNGSVVTVRSEVRGMFGWSMVGVVIRPNFKHPKLNRFSWSAQRFLSDVATIVSK